VTAGASKSFSRSASVHARRRPRPRSPGPCAACGAADDGQGPNRHAGLCGAPHLPPHLPRLSGRPSQPLAEVWQARRRHDGTLRFSRRAWAASSRRTPESPINKIAAARCATGAPLRRLVSVRELCSVTPSVEFCRSVVHRSADSARSTCTSTSRDRVAGSSRTPRVAGEIPDGREPRERRANRAHRICLAVGR